MEEAWTYLPYGLAADTRMQAFVVLRKGSRCALDRRSSLSLTLEQPGSVGPRSGSLKILRTVWGPTPHHILFYVDSEPEFFRRMHYPVGRS